jgi:hypothetical protein
VLKLGRDFCAFGSMSAPALALMANKCIDKRISKLIYKPVISIKTRNSAQKTQHKYTT